MRQLAGALLLLAVASLPAGAQYRPPPPVQPPPPYRPPTVHTPPPVVAQGAVVMGPALALKFPITLRGASVEVTVAPRIVATEVGWGGVHLSVSGESPALAPADLTTITMAVRLKKGTYAVAVTNNQYIWPFEISR